MPDKHRYNTVAENPNSTVAAETADYNGASHYQSEAALEKAFIAELAAQGYDYLPITCEQDLITNLRRQLEKLNDMTFSDSEWENFFASEIGNRNAGIAEKTETIQQSSQKVFYRDDGSFRNLYLIKKHNDEGGIHDNTLQVINQYAVADGTRPNRYDVTVLVNGLPLVHIELKRRGVAIAEAFNQIARYQRESFWAGCGLFEYVQLFVISNGTHTKYYSNTTRTVHIAESKKGRIRKGKRSSNSFEFTSWWAYADNKPVQDLMDFAKTFFARHTLLAILTRYCVLTSERQLLAMRPYQIVATEEMMKRIAIGANHHKLGTTDAGGYVWHTTGSGKTLTSFKAAQLASRMEEIDKVLFVVDRKDLDYQTVREYDKFAEGAANGNTSTAVLRAQLEDRSARILITTIQKLDRFVKKNRGHPVLSARVVLIFDECHRSQFGEMHEGIARAFKRYHLFGFTGTPIFAKNAPAAGQPGLKTTAQAFGKQLHTYTIVHAIGDKNVLPFKVDYVATMKEKENIADKKVADIAREKALLAPARIAKVTEYILTHFDRKTKRNASYKIRERRLRGFNSLFAVSSIDAAKRYYAEFCRQLADAPSDRRLKVAVIFSFGANEPDADGSGVADENPESTAQLPPEHRDFLDAAIADYNRMFATNYDTSPEGFQNYYQDLSRRVKDREVDILIVVNMFLTGFDATTLNTLWVDKNLRMHGLLQAYSRTNRILNSVKTFGNIVCFRNLERATNESIALFGDREAGGIVLLKSFAEYYNGYTDGDKTVPGYTALIAELQSRFPVGERIDSEQAKKDFVRLYGRVLRLRNILTAFDEFAGKELLSERDRQDYHSRYIDLYEELRGRNGSGEEENITDDIVFEMELIRQVEINIDYILDLIRQYHASHQKDRAAILHGIDRAVDTSVELRNKKELIRQFIATLNPQSVVDDDWQAFVGQKQGEELDDIIAAENLNAEKARAFVRNAFRDGGITTAGTDLSEILPPISMFDESGAHTKKRKTVIQKLTAFFTKFHDITPPASP